MNDEQAAVAPGVGDGGRGEVLMEGGSFERSPADTEPPTASAQGRDGGLAGTSTAHGRSISVTDVGATGLGVADDLPACQAAVDAVATDGGGGVVWFPAGQYRFGGPLVVPANVTVQGAGQGATRIFKSASITTPLTADVSKGDATFQVASVSGLALGMAVNVQDDEHVYFDSTQGWITDITGNAVTVGKLQPGRPDGAVEPLTVAANGVLSTSHSLITTRFDGYDDGAENVTIRDLTLDQNAGSSDPFLSPSGADLCNLVVATIHMESSRFCRVENVAILNAVGDAYSDQGRSHLVGTNFNTIDHCRIVNARRHAIHTGTTCSGAVVSNNYIVDCGGAAHFYCRFSRDGADYGNIVVNCFAGFAGIDGSDSGNIVSSNTIRGCMIAVHTKTRRITEESSLAIVGNTIVTADNGSGIRSCLPRTTITGNTVQVVGMAGRALELSGRMSHDAAVTGNHFAGGGAVQRPSRLRRVLLKGRTRLARPTTVERAPHS